MLSSVYCNLDRISRHSQESSEWSQEQICAWERTWTRPEITVVLISMTSRTHKCTSSSTRYRSLADRHQRPMETCEARRIQSLSPLSKLFTRVRIVCPFAFLLGSYPLLPLPIKSSPPPYSAPVTEQALASTQPSLTACHLVSDWISN